MVIRRILILTTFWAWLPGCEGEYFPTCRSIECDPCLECDHLAGYYEGWMTDFENSCLDMDIGMPDQPWSLSVPEVKYDGELDQSYIEFELTEDLGGGVYKGIVCAPEQDEEALSYSFCLNFSYPGMVEQDHQTTEGAFIERGTQPIEFEGVVWNKKTDPTDQECVISAKAHAVMVDVGDGSQ